VFGTGLRALGHRLLPWVVPITVACYLVVAVLAQVRLDVLRALFP
jgi:hypothetical protein